MFGMSKPKPKPGPKAQKRVAAPKEADPGVQEEKGLVEVRLSLTTAQLQKLDRLGGAEWVGKQIDRAREKSA